MVSIGNSIFDILHISKKIYQLLLDAIFPKFCLYCNTEEVWVCTDCKETLKQDPILACPSCKVPSFRGKLCSHCQDYFHLDYQISLLDYKKSPVKKLLKKFKYQYIVGLSEVIAEFIADFSQDYPDVFTDSAVIVPVPLYYKKYNKRGFNQAQIIGNILSQQYNLPITQALQKTEATKNQAELTKPERKDNVRSVFNAKSDLLTDYKSVVLVDDVFTTGSTLNECAKELKRNSDLDNIYGFTIARGV